MERPRAERRRGTVLNSLDKGALSQQGGKSQTPSRFSPTGYHVLGGLDTVLLFQTTICEDEWTKRFLQGLHRKLRQLEIKQHCKFQLASASCFPSLSNRPDEFIIKVQLEGKAPG